MRLDRKTFLKALSFAGGGALGVMTSPAPWQLIRDLARWTQNWPWAPAPLHGKPSAKRAICGMCNGGCGVVIRKVDERMVQVTGNKAHPINRGFICPLGTAQLQMVYGPSRIRRPLKRTGARGEGKWKEISWEEGIGEFAANIQKLRSEQQSQSIVCVTNNVDGTINELLGRFLHAIGSKNIIKTNSGKDVRSLLLKLMQGVEGDLAYDFENADLILSFGCSFLDGWGSCGRMYGNIQYWHEPEDMPSVQMIQIEPNLSTTASKASKWIPLAPGSEAALALGIAHVMISEGSYNKEFVENHCFGFEDWEDSDGKKHQGFKSKALTDYSPPSVEKITGVGVKDIENLAHRFSFSERPLAVAGGGKGDQFSSVYELMAIHSLNALAGNINQRGGVLVKASAPLQPLPEIKMDDEAKRAYSQARLDGAGGEVFPLSKSLPGNLRAAEVKLLLVHESNPFYAMPEQAVAEQLFKEAPYIVSLSTCMDESAQRSDLVLPLSSRLERWDDHAPAPELPSAVYDLSPPVIEPLHQTKDAGEIIIQTARKLGGTIAESFPWENTEEVLRERTRGLYESGRGLLIPSDPENATVTQVSSNYSFPELWERLQEHGCWIDQGYEYGDPRKILKTADQKFEFFSRTLQEKYGLEDEKLIPHHEPPGERSKDFNLLIMAEDLLIMGDDGKATPPFLMKQLDANTLRGNDLFAQVNPITAMYQNLSEGDHVILESPAGQVSVRLHLHEGIREGVVLIPLGFGHSAFDQFLRGKGVNANRLIVVQKDGVSGLPLWRLTPGKITRREA